MKRRSRQFGGVSVEMALCAPVLILVIVGGVHFGRVLMTRHKLAEATNYATRAAAVSRNTNATVIRNQILARMGSGSGCSSVNVTSSTTTDAIGVRRVEVRSVCNVNTGFGGALLGAIGPDQLEVSAAMPY
jgi:Flp pilus assembly protein TadG